MLFFPLTICVVSLFLDSAIISVVYVRITKEKSEKTTEKTKKKATKKKLETRRAFDVFSSSFVVCRCKV